MKKIFLVIGMAAVMSNAGCGIGCNKKLERIANALERIATSMEKQQIQAQKNTIPPKQEITRINGRSLKAVPTVSSEEDRLTCILTCRDQNVRYDDFKKCTKETCGEE